MQSFNNIHPLVTKENNEKNPKWLMVAIFVTTRLHRTFQTGFEGKNLKSGLGGDIIKRLLQC